MALLTELPYLPDSSVLFAPLARRPWSAFLDSGHPLANGGRWDIISADPFATLVTTGTTTEIRTARGTRRSHADPFALLRELLGEPATATPNLPFCGGAIGWLGYDLARRIERLPNLAQDAEGTPEMAIGLYDWALLVDHAERRSWLVGANRDPLTAQRWPSLARQFSSSPSAANEDAAQAGLKATAPLRSNMTFEQYAAAFERVQAYIREGDCYQVNLAQRFIAPVAGDGWNTYRSLRASNPAPYAAFLNTPFAQVLSSSPERFLSLRHGQVETRPIKGTRARGPNVTEDIALRSELLASAKDRAENLMIVDLLRNDLGRVCIPGSIEVPSLFAAETYATVHHLVSTVRGRLAEREDATSLLRACFPGGSITGAPKIRAMEIIEELEPHRRGIYCGSIGYLGFDGSMDTNIAIRTLVRNGSTARFWAGGGIVYDSNRDQEYRETLDKAAALLRLFD
jgi:para-aminobenzoate synthetase component 1